MDMSEVLQRFIEFLIGNGDSVNMTANPIAFLAAGVGANLLGSLFGAGARRRASRRLIQQSKRNITSLRDSFAENISRTEDAYQGAYGTISATPELDIDTSHIDDMLAGARRASERLYGRAIGEEASADLARQSTADAVSRVREGGGSMSDIIGYIADIDAQERRQMTEIGISSMREKAAREERILGNLSEASYRKADFYRGKDLAEFEAERQKLGQLASLSKEAGLTLSDMMMRRDLAILDAQNALASAQAQMAANSASVAEGIMSGIGGGLMNFGMAQGMSQGFGGGGGGGNGLFGRRGFLGLGWGAGNAVPGTATGAFTPTVPPMGDFGMKDWIG